MVEHKPKFFHTPMGLAKDPHVSFFKLSKSCTKGMSYPVEYFVRKSGFYF